MKLHIDVKKRKAIQRSLSILLVACMVLSSGSTSAVAGGSIMEGHVHEDSCYGKMYVCGLEEHGSDCWQDRLKCNQGEDDGHVHTDSCYEAVWMGGCGMEEHNDSCYKKVLACGYGAADMIQVMSAEDPAVQSVALDDAAAGLDGDADSDYEDSDTAEVQGPEGDAEIPAEGTPGTGDDAQSVETPGESEEAGAEEMPEESTDGASGAEPEEGTDEAPEESGDAGAAQAPEESGDATADMDPEEGTDAGAAEIPEESGDRAPGGKPEEGTDAGTEAPEGNPGEEAERPEEPEAGGQDAFDEDEKKLVCEEEHDHTADCYRQLFCGIKEHIHTEDCYDQEHSIICEMEEHGHTAMCLLPGEEQQKIKELAELIAALPGAEELADLEARHEAGDIEEKEYFEQCARFKEQAEEALEIYLSLTEEARGYVPGAERLEELAEMLEAMIGDGAEEPAAFHGEYRDDRVIVSVTAEPGVIPEGAELSVRQVVPQETGRAMMAAAIDQEAAAEAQELNEKYEEVQKELEASVAEDDTKEIAGFLAYDISFLLTDENGETREIEPEGNVSVSMDFVEAYLPEELADSEGLEIDSVEVVHMKEVQDAETGQTTLQAEVLEGAQVSTTESAELEKAEFVVAEFSIFTISWTTKDGLYNVTLEAVCVDESGKVIEGIDWSKKIGDITITKEDSEKNNRGRVHLPAQAPYLPGYSLERIVLGNPKTQEMSDEHVEEIYFSDNQKRLQRERGTWINGKWVGQKKYIAWNNDIKKVYFVYKTIVPPTPSIKPEEEKVPAHRKYIKYNEIDDDYTLTLDVVGERDIQDIDILLIVDTSGSMKNLEKNDILLPDEQQRFSIVNNALDKLDDGLKEVKRENEEININVGIMTFAGDAGSGATNLRDWFYLKNDNRPDAQQAAGWTPVSSTTGFSWRLDKEAIGGATNWQAAIRTGEEMLRSSTSSGQKYVIFLTDGDPTVRYAAGSDTMTVGTGAATLNLTDKKYGDQFNNNYDAAINEWSMSPGWQSVAGTYVIAVADQNKTDEATNSIRIICGQFAKAIRAKMYSGQDEESLGQAFEGIVDNIKYSAFKKVVIRDTLSEYVEFAEENPAFTVTHTKLADGTDPNASAEVLFEKTDSDKDSDMTIAADEYTISYTKKDAAGNGTNSIAFSVLNGADLEDSVRYSISFKVKPTEKAVREYIAAGYPHVGEGDTDAPYNETSSGKPGFNSNYDERAKVNYTYNDHQPNDTDYRHPVVQVHKPGDDAGITKTMGKAEEGNRYPITIQIKCGKIENNMLVGSTGAGWTVTDDIAAYTHFISFKECTLNGHHLTLSQNGDLMTEDENGKWYTVATYSPGRDGDMSTEMQPMTSRGAISSGLKPGAEGEATGTITWYLNPELADVVIDADGNGYCSYTLTYYVDFSDSGKTEIRNTNTTTYIAMPGDNGSSKYLYPEKMPFFVNVVGNKKSAVNGQDSMEGARFNVYRDSEKTDFLAEKVISDSNGHFAFQLGQSDLCDVDLENGSMTVYLEEAEAPEGYERDETIHPITVAISNITYVANTTQEKANPGIWDISPDKDWGSVKAGSIEVSHDPHDGTTPDFLSIENDNGVLQIEYYNTKPWRVLKVSASQPELALEGAEFALYKAADDADATSVLAYTGTSDADGYVEKWKPADESGSEVLSHLLPAGTYELRETKAPSGYALSGEKWQITISEKGQVSITVKDGGSVAPSEDRNFVYKDEILYSLPSTGGMGIYWYLIGGTLSMMAAVLVSYRNKRNKEREVLRN